MLRCQTCIRRTLSIVLDDAWGRLPPQSALTAAAPSRIRTLSHRHQSRSYAAAASTAASPISHDDPNSHRYYQSPPTSRPSEISVTSSQQTERKSFIPSWRTPNGPNAAKVPKEPQIIPSDATVQHEIRWLRDPLKLADRVAELLGQGDYSTALAISRAASKDLQCTVSWNHLVDYNMARGRRKEAVKTYNEMKKRAQVPDARTYTTLFRGFGWSIQTHNHPSIVAEALKIYHAMFFDKSPVRPTIIHTNAVLKVCAFAGDMDALFGVASKLPEKGNGAPDTVTYYTILNAIRNSVADSIRGGNQKSRVDAVRQGMRIWEDIKERWIKGDLLMSEELVCAMGRLLLVGGQTGADDVLSLIEQTMGVPRQVPRLGNPGRYGAKRMAEKPADGHFEDGSGSSGSMDSPSLSHSHQSATESQASPPSSLFAPIPKVSKDSLVRPSRNTLSLAIEACTAMLLPRPAQDYWGLFTASASSFTSSKTSSKIPSYNILPDSANYHSYLRLLRLQRASALAASLVSEMQAGTLPVHESPQSGRPNSNNNNKNNTKIITKSSSSTSLLAPKTFRIALSTCLRDKNNPNSLSHATTLINIMTATLEDADAPSLTTYLDLATTSSHSRDSPPRLLDAERAALPAWRNLRSLLSYAPPSTSATTGSSSPPSSSATQPPTAAEEAEEDGWAKQSRARKAAIEARGKLRAEVAEAGKKLVGLYSRILDTGREELDKKELKRVGGERARVGVFIERVDRREGSLDRRGRGGKVIRLHYSDAGSGGGGVAGGEVKEGKDEEGEGWRDPGGRKLREHRGSFSFRPRGGRGGEGEDGGEIVEEEEEVEGLEERWGGRERRGGRGRGRF